MVGRGVNPHYLFSSQVMTTHTPSTHLFEEISHRKTQPTRDFPTLKSGDG